MAASVAAPRRIQWRGLLLAAGLAAAVLITTGAPGDPRTGRAPIRGVGALLPGGLAHRISLPLPAV